MLKRVSPSSSNATPVEHEDFAELERRDRLSRRGYRWRTFFIWLSVGAFFFWFIPFIPALFFSTITVTRLDARGKPIEVDVGPGTKNWVSIEKVSRHFVHAVVVAEDAKFFQHFGFDFESIGKAIELNRQKGRYVRGASTISQQLVKIVFLSREKTIIRKAREAVGTIFLELLLSKDQILEWYINLCEFGGGIYGAKASGLYYFKTRPELLTIEQAVNLAIVIPSPNKWSQGLRAKSLTPFGQRRFYRIAQNLRMAGYITDVQFDTAMARGNFGRPINTGTTQIEDEECSGEQECEDALDVNAGSTKVYTNGEDAPVVDNLPVLDDPFVATSEKSQPIQDARPEVTSNQEKNTEPQLLDPRPEFGDSNVPEESADDNSARPSTEVP